MTWQKGQSGNPAGRPRGSRDRFSKEFLDAFSKDFAEHGAQVIEQVRESQPAVYLQVAARFVPQGVELDVTDSRRSITEIPTGELIEMLREDPKQIEGSSPAKPN